MARNQIVPEADDELDQNCEHYLSQALTPLKRKKRRLREWGYGYTTESEHCGSPPSDEVRLMANKPTFEEFLEEEGRMSKRPKYAF